MQRPFTVTQAFYNVIRKQPPLMKRPPHQHRSHGSVNAYVFGPMFPLSEYKLIRSHWNDAAQTGLVDARTYTDADANLLADIQTKLDEYDYDNPTLQKEVKARIPSLLWLGVTDGGDAGAKLYAHYAADHIDGLIVDNEYLFPSPELQQLDIQLNRTKR
jgi:hypothetical protein